jgi:PAS domain S-box-containing protein
MAERQSPLQPHVLRELLEGTAGAIGEEFFDKLVMHVALALGTKGAWVTEWLETKRRLRALSFWLDEGFFGDYEYDIAGTPCEPVIESVGLIHVPERVVELYPDDPDLPELSAVSYMGVPLLDTDGQILGHLAILHDKPMPANAEAEAIFRIFASRAASELRRMRRDRDLRDREQKLSRLIDSAMDAIVELDGNLSITGVNPAAERIFACTAADAAGSSFEAFLTPDSRARLRHLIEELAGRPAGQRSLWITDGIDALRRDGQGFPAEATLSGFELDGRPFYTLILRSIDDRLEAEERIRRLMSEAAYLREEIDSLHGFDDIVGRSDALAAVLADVHKVAKGDTTVLITGETGTGKELIARAIHQRSDRATQPLVKVNCAAIAPGLQESEFFGHEKGAFTGALRRREGRFKVADGGTIFLDEVGEMPRDLQAKLLRVLQEGEFEPVGSTVTQSVNVRVIAATNRDLEQMVAEGSFRSDLLYRLNVFPVHVPPLRERGDDVVLLAEAFARRLALQRSRTPVALREDCKAKLRRYDWPGNVRELENVIERGFITSKDGRSLDLDRALPESVSSADTTPPKQERILTVTEMQDLERANLVRALEAARWKISGPEGAAERLGLNPNTLSSRMRSLGIERPRGV